MTLNIPTILRAVEFLKTVPDSQWKFSTLHHKVLDSRGHPCGTIGCAMGNLLLSGFPEMLQAVGIKTLAQDKVEAATALDFIASNWYKANGQFSIASDSEIADPNCLINPDDYIAIAMRVFGMQRDTAHLCFSPEDEGADLPDYATRQDVIDRLLALTQFGESEAWLTYCRQQASAIRASVDPE